MITYVELTLFFVVIITVTILALLILVSYQIGKARKPPVTIRDGRHRR